MTDEIKPYEGLGNDYLLLFSACLDRSEYGLFTSDGKSIERLNLRKAPSFLSFDNSARELFYPITERDESTGYITRVYSFGRANKHLADIKTKTPLTGFSLFNGRLVYSEGNHLRDLDGKVLTRVSGISDLSGNNQSNHLLFIKKHHYPSSSSYNAVGHIKEVDGEIEHCSDFSSKDFYIASAGLSPYSLPYVVLRTSGDELEIMKSCFPEIGSMSPVKDYNHGLYTKPNYGFTPNDKLLIVEEAKGDRLYLPKRKIKWRTTDEEGLASLLISNNGILEENETVLENCRFQIYAMTAVPKDFIW